MKNRDVIFPTRLNAAERAGLDRLAQIEERPRGDVVRRALRAELQKHGLWPASGDKQPAEMDRAAA